MALKNSAIKVELREVDLNNMPEEAIKISPKATVPVLVLPDATFIDESWDIVKWALQQNDPDNWLGDNSTYLLDAEMLVETNDYSFKEELDHYKYADRYPEHNEEYYRESCEEFISELEDMLAVNRYLLADCLSLADIGVFPFVRQFSLVDKVWFEQSSYINVQRWLKEIISSGLFQSVFQKHKLWQAGDPAIYI
jgi:glutathione S-transferase